MRFAVALLLVAVLLYVFWDPSSFVSAISNVSVLGVALVLATMTVDRMVMAFKWARLLGAHTEPPTLTLATQVYCSSMLIGLLLPSTVGADAVRAIAFRQRGYAVEHLLSSITVERVLGLSTTLALAALGLLLLPDLPFDIPAPESPMIIGVLAGGACLLLVALWINFRKPRLELLARWQPILETRIGRGVAGFWRSLIAYRSHPALLANFLVLTLVEQLLSGAGLWLIAVDLAIDAPFFGVFFCSMIAYALSRIPITLGGIGVFEAAFSLTLSTYGVSIADAILIALLGRVLQIATWVPWWVTFAARDDTAKLRRRPPSS